MDKPISVSGPVGNIECLWSECAGASAAALICHPHPLYGGTMYDAIVDTISQAMLAHNISVLRFNFRGVGNSAGEHDGGEGEVVDVNCLVDWIIKTGNNPSIYLAGYSFGAIIALNGACTREDRIKHLFLVAPPVGFQPVPVTVPCSATTIIGDRDQIVDFDALNDWVKSAGMESGYHLVAGADHFFAGKLGELDNLVRVKLGNLEKEQP